MLMPPSRRHRGASQPHSRTRNPGINASCQSLSTWSPSENLPGSPSGIGLTGPIPRLTDYEDTGGPFFTDAAGEQPDALEDELGIRFGETTPDGRFSLEWTPCIGMCDQAPAALVDDIVITGIRPGVARVGVQKLREHGDPSRLVRRLGSWPPRGRQVPVTAVDDAARRAPPG